ncbi:alpha/beta hydrolase-fold protein [Streptomyces abikoensis]|uniref:alpha/beta hydrolase n=1 Tax=Streptomyces abikoensis TaxID=97398 RepID=UPI003404FF16
MSYQSPTTYQARRRPSRAKRWVIAGASVVTLGLIAWPVMSYYEIPPFTDKGDAISFGGSGDGKNGDQAPGSKAQMPLGPKAGFKISGTVPEDGTKIAVTTYKGKKSGFEGKVWVWAPKEYDDPKYAKSGFPVLIALPGGAGYPNNYWMGTDLKLEASISKWAQEGKSLPFIIAMPVLNPENHDKDPKDPKAGLYWDGSDIPGQLKMGTWLTEDVPQLVKENFRTIKSRDGWAFMGSSTGASAGLKSVLQKPDQFKAVIASGPDIVPDSRLWAGHEKEKADNNSDVLAQRLIAKKGPEVYLAFQVGSNEPVKPPIDRFLAKYGNNKGPIKTKYRINVGGEHNAASYVPNMEAGGLIQWVSEHMQGPTT